MSSTTGIGIKTDQDEWILKAAEDTGSGGLTLDKDFAALEPIK